MNSWGQQYQTGHWGFGCSHLFYPRGREFQLPQLHARQLVEPEHATPPTKVGIPFPRLCHFKGGFQSQHPPTTAFWTVSEILKIGKTSGKGGVGPQAWLVFQRVPGFRVLHSGQRGSNTLFWRRPMSGRWSKKLSGKSVLAQDCDLCLAQWIPGKPL